MSQFVASSKGNFEQFEGKCPFSTLFSKFLILSGMTCTFPYKQASFEFFFMCGKYLMSLAPKNRNRRKIAAFSYKNDATSQVLPQRSQQEKAKIAAIFWGRAIQTAAFPRFLYRNVFGTLCSGGQTTSKNQIIDLSKLILCTQSLRK